MSGGTYTLLIELDAGAEIAVGALGVHEFDPGWYAYTGSALGSGGFARVDRHRRLAGGDHDARHWHVDYVLARPGARLARAVTSPGLDAECAIARRIGRSPVAGFGASDCDCASHLGFGSERAGLEDAVTDAHEAARTRGVGRDS